ncbi:MAG: hypothetical protein CMG75_10705 [Candidatus Marinimicrobia bacterium]|nr:hypothetical protein [Candidatus Neomarinimicrobiota bacterium]
MATIKVSTPKIKPKLNKTNIKSPIGQLGGGGFSVGKKFKSQTLSRQFSNQPVLQAPKIDKSPVNTNPIAGVSQTLAETNSILVEIQNQLAIDFADRIANEQAEIRKLKAQKSKSRQADAAGSVTGGAGAAVGMALGGPAGAALGSVADQMLQAFAPIIGIFKKIAGFFVLVGAGFLTNQGLNWITANWDKVAGFFDFLGEHGHKILLGMTFGLGGIIAIKLYKAIKKVIKFSKWVAKHLHRAWRLARVFIKRTLPKMFKNALKVLNSGLKSISKAGKGIFGGILNIGKNVVKGAKNIVSKGASKGIIKATSKSVGKGAGKSLLKKIPVVGLGLGAIFAIDRLRKGDWGGALMELGSGAASMIPGVGTGVSVALDAALIGKDINDAKVNSTDDGSTSAKISSSPTVTDPGQVEEGTGGIVPFPTIETGDSGNDVAATPSGGDSIAALDPDDLGNSYIDFSRDTLGIV